MQKLIFWGEEGGLAMQLEETQLSDSQGIIRLIQECILNKIYKKGNFEEIMYREFNWTIEELVQDFSHESYHHKRKQRQAQHKERSIEQQSVVRHSTAQPSTVHHGTNPGSLAKHGQAQPIVSLIVEGFSDKSLNRLIFYLSTIEDLTSQFQPHTIRVTSANLPESLKVSRFLE